jgi:hypothetical protein
MEYSYNDGRCSGGRRPRLYLVKGREFVKFECKAIPNFCSIASQKYTKNGKWSNTDYVLELVPGVRPLQFLSPLHGTWGDNLGSWGECAEKLGVPVEVARIIVSTEYSTTSVRLDEIELSTIQVENTGMTTEIVIISFGSPTHRQSNEGYWSNPKEGMSSTGISVVVAPGEGDNWKSPSILEPEGCKVVSATHTSGMRGGYWSIEVLVPIHPQ